jgi:hypothetical protein
VETAVVYERTPGAASRPLASPSPPSDPYCRRCPESTVLYQAVAAELAPLDARSPYGHGLPGHVRRQLEAYLDCGVLRRGFVRLVCRRCRFEHLVAFSCRAACPSCAARRMKDTGSGSIPPCA